MKKNKQSIFVDTFSGLLTANAITLVTGILWIYLSPSLASIFLIFGCVGAGAVFMETRPRLTMSFIFIFIYAGFGIFTAEKYWVVKGKKIKISVADAQNVERAARFEFTDGIIISDMAGVRKFCGQGVEKFPVCTEYLVFPFVSEGWKKSDTVFVWAVYKKEEVIKNLDFTVPAFKQAVLERDGLYEKTIEQIVKKYSLKNHKKYLILRFVNNISETVSERKRNTLLFFGTGCGIWLILFPLYWIIKKE